MRARVPQDVDLEDRLVYGLTPVRLGYLVIAALAALSVWGVRSIAMGLRILPCAVIVAAGVGLAWGRWGGRPVDHWVGDIAIFIRRNYRIRLPRPRLLRSRRLRWGRAGRAGPVPLPLRSINDLASLRSERSDAEPAA